jgi:hypothetical protein
MPKPWMKLNEETPKAYEAFCIYRDLGPGRTIPAVQAEYSKSPSYIRQLHEWSSKYDWVDRAAAYDVMVDEKRVEASIDKAVRAAAKHASAAEKLIDKGLEALAAKDATNVTVDGIRGLIGDGVRLQRLSLGLVTDSTKQEVSGNVRIDTTDRVRQLLEDPEATRLACDLAERLGSNKADTGIVRKVREPGPVEAGEAPRVPES